MAHMLITFGMFIDYIRHVYHTQDEYPCIVTLWSGYIGTIMIANSYVVRCWNLFFAFRSTGVKFVLLIYKNLIFHSLVQFFS